MPGTSSRPVQSRNPMRGVVDSGQLAERGRHRSLPYLCCICWPPRTWIVFQLASLRGHGERVGLRGRRGPPRARACDGSRTGPASSRPSASAARTAQPGSPSWRQSRNWQPAARSAMSANAVVEPVGRAGDAERADAWGVDEQRAAGQPDELAMGRGVAAARVVVADGAVRWRWLPSERVDERGLADARGAEHDGGPARRRGGRRPGRATPSPVSAEIGPDLDAGRDGLGGDAQPVEVVGHVGLVEHDHGRRAAGPRDREVALEAAEVEVAVEARHDERDVDVGGEDLLAGAGCRPASGVAGVPAERRPARGGTAWIDGGRLQRPLGVDRGVPPCRRRPSRRRPAGRPGPSASWRSRPEITASRSPVGVATTQASRWAATTRAGRQPAASNGRKAVAQPGSQPRSWRVRETAAVIGASISPTRLSLPVRFAYSLGAPERPEAGRDEHDAHDDQRHDVVPQRRHRHPVEQAGADAVEDVGRRRQLRQHLHPLGQDADRVVHARHEQQARLDDERHLRPALDVQQRQDRGHHPDAHEAERAEQHEHRGRGHVPRRARSSSRKNTISTIRITPVWTRP